MSAEERFRTGTYRALANAEDALRNKRPEFSVIGSHLTAEYALKVLLLRAGVRPEYKGFKESMDELRTTGALTEDEYAELDELRKLRNRVYHEAYLPTEDEAHRAVKTARGISARVKERCSQ